MTTRAVFHFSWVYTFSVTPRSLRICAPFHRERPVVTQHSLRNCVDHLAALSHTGYTIRCKFGLLCMHLYRPVKGQRLDNLPVFMVPWRLCKCYGFFLVFEILNFRRINSTQPTKSQLYASDVTGCSRTQKAMFWNIQFRSDSRSNASLGLIGVARRGQGGMTSHKFLENIDILCFERCFSKQNSVIRLKSNILPPPQFWPGYATARAKHAI